ncbi:ABC transporter ATP-binding protein [Caldanaerobius polysaccharolyticus]|uniref:ABC transporter ATP-binding protein n=1 Tax=Caldanaerobius polysaccharolyticus TaxID=44256 RepID=UPI00047D4E26|nr:ABC transporter ATP-binding protein [Caldanaerobius polysaccharolyticus]
MSTVLKATDLTKKYYRKTALNKVNIELEEGKILGLLGPNGSGKTTFIKIATGLLKPTSGEITIMGKQPGMYTKSFVSYLPDVNFLYRWMKVRDAVDFFRDFYADFNVDKAEELLKFMNLNPDDSISSLSKGMMERLNLSLVLAREAKLYILDEPLAGIDPNSRDRIIDAIISNYRSEGAMIISTHLIKDIEKVFDDVVMISNGNIVIKGNAEELRAERSMSIEEIFKEVFA